MPTDSHNGRQALTLDEELARGGLPTHIIQSIEKMTLTIEEVMKWRETTRQSRVTITKEKVSIELYTELSVKRLVASAGGVTGLLTILTAALYHLGVVHPT